MHGAKHAALGLLLALAAACAQEPKARTCGGNADCPSGSACQAGVCQEGMSIEISAPADQAVTRGAVAVQVTVSGGQPSTVRLLVDDSEIASVGAPYAYTLDTSALTEGAHQLSAAAVEGGRTYRSATRTFFVDRTAPGAPAMASQITNAANPVTVSGTSDPGAAVVVYEGSTQLATATATGAGTWTAQATLAEGQHALTATASDAAGNVSATSAAATVVVDRTAPGAPTVNALTTNAPNPVPITGTAEPLAVVTVYVASVAQIPTVQATAGGTWTANVPLLDGSHTLTATATDAAGNTSASSAPATVVVDRSAGIAPTVNALVTNASPVTVTGSAEAFSTVTVYEAAAVLASGVPVAAGGTWSADVSLSEGTHSITATSTDGTGNVSPRSAPAAVVVDRTAPAAPTVAAQTTNAANPVPVSGTAEVGAVVAVFEGAALLGSGFAAGAGGSWSGTVNLAEGSHAITARATDAAGNVSVLSAAASVVVDRTAPGAPTMASQTTNAANPVPVSGTAEPFSTVAVWNGGTRIGSGFATDGGGAWQGAVTLAAGTWSLSATATDAAGNTSPSSAAATIVVDRTAPASPTVTAQLTNAANPVTVQGTAEAGASVTLYEGATQLISGVVATAGGTWSVSIALAEGSHAISATAADAAGNVSVRSPAATVVVDRTAPAPPSVTAQLTSSANPVTVQGTAETGASVTLYEGATLLASGVVAAGGNWAVAVNLTEGTHALSARATDSAGNVSGIGAASNVVVDRTAPTVTGRTPVNGASNVWSRDAIVVTFSEAISPSSLTASTVTVQAGGVAVSLNPFSLSPDGRTLTLTPNPAALPAVPATITASLTAGVTDLAGNALAPTSWTWNVPAWILGPALHPAGDGSPVFSAALGPDLTMWAGYATSPAGNIATASLTRSAWAGAWSVTGTSPDTGFTTSNHRIAVDGNGLVTLAYVRASLVRVAQYSGTWATISGASGLNISAANAGSEVRIAIDGSNRPVVSWVEAGQVYAKRWEGASWTTVSGPLAITSGTHALAIRPSDGAVAIAVDGHWYENGTPRSGYDVDTSTEISIVYDGSGVPIAAYVPSGTSTVQVVQPGNPPATFFSPLGGAMGTTARGPKLIYRAAGAAGQQLVLAYYEEASGSQALQVLGWNGSSWGSMSSGVGSPTAGFTGSNAPHLMVNGSGVLAATWVVINPVVSDLTPRIYNR